MITYPAIFHKRRRGYWVEFPDLPGCVTEGRSLKHAQMMAKEALTGVLEVRLEYDAPISSPSRIKGMNIRMIEPEITVGVAVTLRMIRKGKGQTMKGIAQKMKVSIGEYQRLEDPRRSNPTVKKLQKVCEALNIEIEELFRKRAA